MKVTNMISARGNKIANQFIISGYEEFGGRKRPCVYFQSYNSIIVKKIGGTTILDSHYWNYSTTTSKYRNLFLGETKKETQKKIDSGEYVLTNLN